MACVNHNRQETSARQCDKNNNGHLAERFGRQNMKLPQQELAAPVWDWCSSKAWSDKGHNQKIVKITVCQDSQNRDSSMWMTFH